MTVAARPSFCGQVPIRPGRPWYDASSYLTSALHFDVPLWERLRIARQLAGCGEKLLVQLHTHPGRAFHSAVDDRLALPRHTGAISIVIPDFADEWNRNLQQVSVNRHLGAGVWEELGGKAVSLLFVSTAERNQTKGRTKTLPPRPWG